MKYCHGQPLLLFHPCIERDFEIRDPELIAAIIALSMRFLDDALASEMKLEANDFATYSRNTVSKRVNDGKIRLSTIQSLVLLSFLDFTGKLLDNELVSGH